MLEKIVVWCATITFAFISRGAADECNLPDIPSAVPPDSARVGKGKTVAAIYAPKPDYPRSARAQHWMGSGCFIMHVDIKSGLVTSVEIVKSIGYKILDDEMVRTLRRWKFEPGKAASKLKVPITFSMTR